jgi:membrane protein
MMISRGQLWMITRRSFQEFADDHCTQMAAAISYYVLFALFPILILAAGILGLVLQNEELETSFVNTTIDYIDYLPIAEGDVPKAVAGITGAGAVALAGFGFIGLLWSGSNMFGIVRRSLNIAYDIDGSRPLVHQKLLDFAMLAALFLFFITSLAATGILRTAEERGGDFPILGPIVRQLGFGWDVVSFLLPMVFSFAAFVLLYWIVPAVHVKPRHVWPGALVAAIMFEAAKLGFSVYLENFSNYEVVFGSLSAVAVFLFWVFISANIMLFGAEVASEYPRVMRGDYDRVHTGDEDEPRTFGAQVWGFVRRLFVHDSGGRDTRDGL